jgi:UDP-N-acetylglucosamine enolpyruvyl transferase
MKLLMVTVLANAAAAANCSAGEAEVSDVMTFLQLAGMAALGAASRQLVTRMTQGRK